MKFNCHSSSSTHTHTYLSVAITQKRQNQAWMKILQNESMFGKRKKIFLFGNNKTKRFIHPRWRGEEKERNRKKNVTVKEKWCASAVHVVERNGKYVGVRLWAYSIWNSCVFRRSICRAHTKRPEHMWNHIFYFCWGSKTNKMLSLLARCYKCWWCMWFRKISANDPIQWSKWTKRKNYKVNDMHCHKWQYTCRRTNERSNRNTDSMWNEIIACSLYAKSSKVERWEPPHQYITAVKLQCSWKNRIAKAFKEIFFLVRIIFRS